MTGFTEQERYRFDLDGFVVRRGVLGHREVDRLNRAIDAMGIPRPADTIGSQRFNGHLAAGPEFRALLDHDDVLGVLVDLCGPAVRLDHAYGLIMAPGTSGLGLHGGGTPHDPSQFYAVHHGRMSNGLVAVMWALVDHDEGRGGFCCIPGSHKAAFPLPGRVEPGWVREIPLRAGDVMIFTEALTHGTSPWRGRGQRRALFHKYAPGHLAWGPDYVELADLAPLLTERQRRLIQKPAIYGHAPVD